MIQKRNFRRYIILPTCLLLLNALEEIMVYKSELIGQPFLRTGVLLVFFLFGFSLVSFFISPILERWMEILYHTGKNKGGRVGIFVLLIALFSGIFVLYYGIYINGPSSIIPVELRNPGQ